MGAFFTAAGRRNAPRRCDGGKGNAESGVSRPAASATHALHGILIAIKIILLVQRRPDRLQRRVRRRFPAQGTPLIGLKIKRLYGKPKSFVLRPDDRAPRAFSIQPDHRRIVRREPRPRVRANERFPLQALRPFDGVGA